MTETPPAIPKQGGPVEKATPKMDRQQQMAEWRRQQRTKSQKNLKTWGERASKEFLRARLRVWGSILGVAGLMTVALNAVLVSQGNLNEKLAELSISWGVIVIVVAVLDFAMPSIGMLAVTGCVGMIHGLFVTVSGGLVWGPVFLVAGIIMLIDVAKIGKARKQKREAEEAKAAEVVVATSDREPSLGA